MIKMIVIKKNLFQICINQQIKLAKQIKSKKIGKYLQMYKKTNKNKKAN